MKKTILEVYALAVCLFAVIVITITSSILIYNIVGVLSPKLTMSGYKYEKYQNNENFKSKNGISKDDAKSLSEDEITSKRETAYVQEIRAEKRGNFQTILNSAIYLLVSSVILLIHWKISKQSRETAA
jgi:hypothetical protein